MISEKYLAEVRFYLSQLNRIECSFPFVYEEYEDYIHRISDFFDEVDTGLYANKVVNLDWASAPAWATHHAFRGDGSGAWLLQRGELGPCIKDGYWNTYGSSSGYELPAGIDWRLTLSKRPEL